MLTVLALMNACADIGAPISDRLDPDTPDQADTGAVLEPCASSTECEPGFRCVDARCLKVCIDNRDCPSEQSCRGGLCAESDCPEGSCDDHGQTCVPGARWCEDGMPIRCSSEGMALATAACEPGFACLEGDCAPVSCTSERSAVCDGDHIVVCDDEGESVRAIISCGDGDFLCRDGACVPRSCAPGSLRCADRSLWRCAEDGTSWHVEQTCGPLEICEGDACLPAGTCQPGERRCDGETVVVCRESRVGFDLVEGCPGYCEGGVCHAAVCESTASWCEGNTAYSCDVRGRQLSSFACGPDAVCDGGRCIPRLCTPGGTRCDSGRRLSCDSAGTSWETSPCGPGDVCMAGACLPEGTLLPDGAACDRDEHCLSGECLGGPGFPQGYCSFQGCQGPSDCLGGGLCLTTTGVPFCAAVCEADADCRSGYGCFAEGSLSVCRAVNEPGPFGSSFPFATSCDSTLLQANLFDNGDGLRQFRFTAGEAQTGIFVGLLHVGGRAVRPWDLIDASSTPHPLAREYLIYEANVGLMDGRVGLLIPSSPAHAGYVTPGQSHRLRISSPNDEVCAYFIPTLTAGLRVDLNVVTVGLDLEAEDGDRVRGLIDEVRLVLEQAGLRLGIVRLREADAEVAERFSVLRELRDLDGLLSTGRAPGPSWDEALTVDVYLVRDFAFATGSVVGISSGLPGLAGLHGQPGTGLAVSTASLEIDPGFTAQVIAHELGHFLGLAHTSEVWGETIEPIGDTPECGLSIELSPDWCPDATNLMFPYALERSVRLSEGQLFVLQSSPLTKPET